MQETLNDIVESKESFYQLLVESIDIGILMTDNSNSIVFVNEPFCKLLGGYKKEELLGKNVNETFPDRKERIRLCEKANERNDHVSRKGEKTLLTKNGENLPLHVCEYPVNDSNGNITGWIELYKNLSEIKSLKQKLKSALDERNKLLSNIREAFFSVDKTNDKTLFLSDAHEDIYGYSVREMLKNPNLWYEVVHPEDKRLVEEKIQLFSKGQTAYDEHRIIRKDGKVTWVECKVSPTLDETGKLIRIDGFVSDISKRKKEEHLKNEKINDLNTFIYKTTHDLKSPLASLTGLMKLVKKKIDVGEVGSYFDMMDRSVERMQVMLNDLTTIIETPHKKLNPEVIDFKNLLEELKNEIMHLLESEKIDFSVDIPQGSKFIADKKLVLTILRNLINNSIKYRSAVNPFIKIIIEEDVKGVKIKVTDNGIGIAENLQEKVFDMFFRGTEVSSGTGLGLYIVKTTVQKLYGKITVQSKKKEGTAFTVYLPDIQKYFVRHSLSN